MDAAKRGSARDRRRADQFPRSLVEASLDAIIVMNAEGRVTLWNRQAATLFGWSREEATGVELAVLIVPERMRQSHRHGLARYLETGEGRMLNRHVETWATDRGGREFPVELAITPFRQNGEISFTGYVRDITQRKQLEAHQAQQLNEAMLLYRATEIAATSDSLDVALKECLSIICEMIGWPVGHAYVPDATGRKLVPTGLWHVADEEQYAELIAVTEEMSFGPGEGLPGTAWCAGEPKWITNADGHPTYLRARRMKRPDLVGSALAFPVSGSGGPLAVLEFFTSERIEEDPSLLLMVRSVGDQIGRVIERQQAQARQELLHRELRHRVNNILMVVQALAIRASVHAADLEEFMANFNTRLNALARAQGLISRRGGPVLPGAGLHEVVRAALAAHLGDDGRIRLNVPRVIIDEALAVSLIVTLHELATNAVKYGALSGETGLVEVSGVLCTPEGKPDAEPHVQLVWREREGPPVAAPENEGFGLSLILRALASTQGGAAHFDWRPEGLQVTLDVPISN